MYNFKDIYINDWYTIVGPIEKNSNLTNYNSALDNYYFGEKTIEEAEIKMQKEVIDNLTKSFKPELVVGMDLLDQLIVSNLSLTERCFPYMGIYSACASAVSGLITIANFIQSRNIKNGMYITSSHNLNAEKQFRFPIEYGAPKPLRSNFTATGAVGLTVSKKKGKIKLINGTLGCVIDSYVKDVYNMGAIMAPSAADTLIRHLNLTNTKPNDYDLILSGDLGEVGANILKELLKKQNVKLKNYIDAGSIIYNTEKYAGASGPTVILLILLNNIILNTKYKKILLLATGALHSPLLVNQKNTIPAVTHALTIEVIS